MTMRVRLNFIVNFYIVSNFLKNMLSNYKRYLFDGECLVASDWTCNSCKLIS